MSATATLMALSEVRARAADALEPEPDSDLTVHADYPDAIHPPALLLLWDDPWLEPGVPQARTFGPCLWNARLFVLALAGRLEPGEGITTLEELVTYTTGRLRDDPYPWPVATVQSPRAWIVANINYLGARISYQVPVTI